MTIEIPELTHLQQEFDALREEFAALRLAVLPATVSRSDIARELGRSYEWVRTHPWSQPNYGIPEVAGKTPRWRREIWDTWKVELPTHRRRWEAMPPQQREDLVRRSA